MDTNWLDEIFQDGSISNVDVSASGGEGKVQYMISGANFAQEGLIRPTGLRRTSGRLNLDFLATDKFKFGTSLLYARPKEPLGKRKRYFGSLTTAFSIPPIFQFTTRTVHTTGHLGEPVAVANETTIP